MTRRDLALYRMRRDELLDIYEDLRVSGFRLQGPPENLTRSGLRDAIERAEKPSTVFGHSRVIVEKVEAKLSWAIYGEEGRPPMLMMKWLHAFDWQALLRLTTAADQIAALSACLRVQPLSDDDLDLLFTLHPKTRTMEIYEVDEVEDEWELDDIQEEPEPPARESGPSTEARTPSLGRKITF